LQFREDSVEVVHQHDELIDSCSFQELVECLPEFSNLLGYAAGALLVFLFEQSLGAVDNFADLLLCKIRGIRQCPSRLVTSPIRSIRGACVEAVAAVINPQLVLPV